jgi:predicted Zn-dependent protease with MMP-like domain
MAYQVSKQRFGQLVEQALELLPEQFARFLEEVPVEVRDRSSPKQRQSVGLEKGHLLLGLYHGRPLTERSVEQSGTMPDVIYIFQEDVQLACDSEDELVD